METIVVGVDGSEGGAAALEFAAREAAFREGRLRIVSAWQVPVVSVHGGDIGPPPDPATVDAYRAGAQRLADEALAALKKLHPSLAGEAVAVEGHPADVLL